MNFTELKEQIKFATKQAFIEMCEKHKDERIYAFALYSDEGAMTVCPSTNTLDYLEMQEDDEDFKYYKFEPAEWKYEMVGADKLFAEISELCHKEADKVEDEEFGSFKNQLYSTCIDVLQELKSEDFFKQTAGEDIFLIFTISDDEFSKKEVKKIVNRLNDNDYNKEYFDWMKEW